MLAIELLLLTGNYVATAYNDRDACEWPPHPARLFSALVATHHAQESPCPAERRALLWLEKQAPPHLQASNLDPSGPRARDVLTHFVPVNDTSVLGKLADPSEKVLALEQELEETRQALVAARAAAENDRAEKRLEKQLNTIAEKLNKARANHEALVAKALGPQDKVSAAALTAGVRLLPERRLRQPRTFPSIAPEQDTVVFSWPEAKPTKDVLSALDTLLSQVTRVGHSSSLVRLRRLPAERVTEPNLIPREDASTYLRVPLPGQLARLEEAFALHQEGRPRVMPAGFQAYGPPNDSPIAGLRMSSFGHRPWLVLEVAGQRGALLGTQAAAVSQAVRNALMAMHGDPSEFLSGHSPEGPRSLLPHLAVVPLPWVDAKRADGHLLGVALVFPRECAEAHQSQVYRALDAWERGKRADRSRQLSTHPPTLPLHLPGGMQYHLRRLTELPRLRGLMSLSWMIPRQQWVTATPIALDHNPGDLYARNPEKAGRAYARAARSIITSCAWLGLPQPKRVLPMLNAPLAGGSDARKYPPFPLPRRGDGTRKKFRRILMHACIEFSEPIMGPLLIGAGRYQGLGLLYPVENHPLLGDRAPAGEATE